MESINSLKDQVFQQSEDYSKKNMFPCNRKTMTSESFAHKLPLA